MVLVDTSVWVSHLRAAKPALEKLLFEIEVACHPYIIGELACGNIKNRIKFLSLLQALPMTPVVTQEEFLHFVDSHKIMATGVGFVDVHIMASARLAHISLWTKDTKLKSVAARLGLLHV